MTKYTNAPTTPDALRTHAHGLARAFNARVLECAELKPEQACALPGERVVLASPIIDETTYAVVLHELGHLASALGTARFDGVEGHRASLQCIEEDAAWDWARHYALLWTPVMEAVATWARSTYEVKKPNVGRVSKSIDWSRYGKK